MNQSGSEPLFDSEKWPVVGNNCYDYAFEDNRRFRRQRSEPGERGHVGDPNDQFVTCGRGKKSMTARILADNPRSVYYVPKGREDSPCARGYYKVMAFVSPGGDFHFYKQVGAVRYRIQKDDTISKIARFFRVPVRVVRESLEKIKKPKNATDGLIDNSGNSRTMSTLHSSLTDKVITMPVNLWAHKLGWGTRPLLVDASGKTIVDPRKANRNYELKYKTYCGSYCVKKGARTGV